MTQWRQVDYNIATDSLVGVGRIEDSNLKGTTSSGLSTIALYKGTTKEYAWGKWISISMVIQGVAFNVNGRVVAAHMDSNAVMFFRGIDGTLINCQKYTTFSS